jgi:hypothetical protein
MARTGRAGGRLAVVLDVGDEAATKGRPSELPALAYELVIAGTEGDVNVPAWVELGLVLADIGGWRFELEDGMALWRCLARPELWATARAGIGEPVFELFRADADDEATNWTRPTPGELLKIVEELADGRTPMPTVRLGPWIEQEWLERLSTTTVVQVLPS